MLRDRIVEEIERHGPMRFDRFMEISLYDPNGGFFGSGPLRSDREGDFLTSPEVSPLFGRTLGAFAAAERARVGEPFVVVECGAGSGSLLSPLLEVASVPAYAVEASPAARLRLEALSGVTVVPDLGDVPRPTRGVVIANELLDNLASPIAVRRGAAWNEVAVTTGHHGLAWTEIDARGEVAAWADRHGGTVPEGGRVEVQLAAAAWIHRALDLLAAGAVVVIDYGDDTAGLAGRRDTGTMRTYRSHHLGPDPLVAPGSMDITMDVDFTALAAVARDAGAAVEVTTQTAFLERWGLRDALSRIRHAELDAARRGDTMQRLWLRSEVTGAETLLHPRGLGDFRVLVATKEKGPG